MIICCFVYSENEVYKIQRTLLDTQRNMDRHEGLFLVADSINKASSVLQNSEA